MSEVQSITVEQLTRQCQKIADLRWEESQLSMTKKKITEELEIAEKEMLEMLTASNLKNFKSSAGLVSITHRTSVKTPKTEEDRQAFFEFLKSKGLYDSMISVNSATLNSFYKAEFEEAKERGDDDFEIPGIKEVTIDQNLSFRRG